MMTVCTVMHVSTVIFICYLGVYVGWSPIMAAVKEGDQFMINLVLDRKPGINFTVSITVSNIDTSGEYSNY